MVNVLTQDELDTELQTIPGWAGDTNAIARTFAAPEFLTGIRFTSAVADAAEQANHHPDIDIRWRKVTMRLATHSEGGVTGKDVELARQIDMIASQHGCD